MKQPLATAGGHGAALMTDNDTMTRSAPSPLTRVLKAPFRRRARVELWYTVVSVPLAFAGFVFIAATMVHPALAAASAPGVRRFGDISRRLARELLGEDVPAPPPLEPEPHVHARTSDAPRLAALAAAEGARVRQRRGRVKITGLPASRVAELASGAQITTSQWRQHSGRRDAAARDKAAWRARGYFAVKLPLAVAGLVVVGGTWFEGLIHLTAPVWWRLAPDDPLLTHYHVVNLAAAFALIPLGAALLLAAPFAIHGVTNLDRSLIRGLLGPASGAERVRTLEETRARAVDDSAARLRGIERDLHDGAQAQLVALAMKLGLAKDKLSDAAPADLARVTQLVDDAHRGAIEAIADLRTLARGIHPPVLDSGLTDALATLAARSAVPVELVTDIPDRPSAAIETIAYFSAAELITNAVKHSGARHVTLEAVHVPGLLRVRVSDDGSGGATALPHGGLRGLADRVRTVDGRLDISSPRGGPTVVTVELPSRA